MRVFQTTNIGKTICFAKKSEDGYSYAEPELKDGLYWLEDDVYICTTSFIVADHCLSVLNEPVLLAEHDDHEGLRGVMLTPDLHKSLKFAYKDFRFTGKLDVAYNEDLDNFYCWLTTVNSGVGFIRHHEFENLMRKSRGQISRRVTVEDGQRVNTTFFQADNGTLVYHVTPLGETKVLPDTYFMIVQDNKTLGLDRLNYPTLLKGMDNKVSIIQIKYAFTVLGFEGLPGKVTVDVLDVFADVLQSYTLFDKTKTSKMPPTTAQILELLKTNKVADITDVK